MKQKKWASLFAAAVICTAALTTGCTSLSSILGENFDADQYVKGVLDCTYLGEYTDYMATTGATEEEAIASYESGLAAEASAFSEYFGFSDYYHSDSVDAQLQTDLAEFYREAYSHANYEVRKAIQSNSGYTVEVTIRPIDLFSAAAEELDTYIKEIQSGLETGQFDQVSEADFYYEYASKILNICKNHAADPPHLEEVTLVVQIQQDEDGVYRISDTDFQNLDAEIIYYP